MTPQINIADVFQIVTENLTEWFEEQIAIVKELMVFLQDLIQNIKYTSGLLYATAKMLSSYILFKLSQLLAIRYFLVLAK